MDWDDIYEMAYEWFSDHDIENPTDKELNDKAQEIYEDMASNAYDRAKDFRKYGE